MKAFPWLEKLDSTDPYTMNPVSHGGMDLRDYFAAKAMQIVGKNWCLVEYSKDDKRMDESVANFCYQIADSMMKAREQ